MLDLALTQTYWLRTSDNYYKKGRDAVSYKSWSKQRARLDIITTREHSIFELAIDETEFDIAVDNSQSVAKGHDKNTYAHNIIIA